jgi:transcriptional regulator with XRE-family HTH domain
MNKLERLQNKQKEIILRIKLAHELKTLRKQYNITQEEFAKYLGYSVIRIKTYEQAKGIVTSNRLASIINKLKRMHNEIKL